jgi:hypothetical protein
MPATLFILAIIVCLFHLLFTKKNRSKKYVLELLIIYLLVFCFGVNGIITFIAHVFFPAISAKALGWPDGGPFQFEVGIANLAIGSLGILTIWFRNRFALATIIANTIFLWGCAIEHLLTMAKYKQFAQSNAVIYFYADIFMPIIIITLYVFYKNIHETNFDKFKWIKLNWVKKLFQ